MTARRARREVDLEAVGVEAVRRAWRRSARASASRAAGFVGSTATGARPAFRTQSSGGSPSGSHAFHQSSTFCPRSWRAAIQAAGRATCAVRLVRSVVGLPLVVEDDGSRHDPLLSSRSRKRRRTSPGSRSPPRSRPPSRSARWTLRAPAAEDRLRPPRGLLALGHRRRRPAGGEVVAVPAEPVVRIAAPGVKTSVGASNSPSTRVCPSYSSRRWNPPSRGSYASSMNVSSSTGAATPTSSPSCGSSSSPQASGERRPA